MDRNSVRVLTLGIIIATWLIVFMGLIEDTNTMMRTPKTPVLIAEDRGGVDTSSFGERGSGPGPSY